MKDATVHFRMPGEPEGSPSGTGFGLPADLLRQSRRRIRIVALLVLLASGADVVIMAARGVAALFGWAPAAEPPGGIPLLGTIVSVASAVAMVIAAGSRRISNRTLLQLALAFEVFLCFVLSLSNPDAIYESTGTLPNLTWVTPLIILFPLIVPCPPRRTLVTAVIAAAMRPLGLALLVGAGRVQAGAEAYFTAIFSPAMAVVFAYFGSRVVYGLGIEVARARQMGSYLLETRLGGGGMGEVWLGRHRLLARPAAVKLIRPDFPGLRDARDARVVLERFEREAQATAALRSPHTIGLYDFGVNDEGTFYYVMELLDGLDTDSLVRRFGPVSAERAVGILRQVCHSLAEAHDAGLIHRDIKPANVYVCRYGRDFDFVKVLDFGLVKTPSDFGGAATLTADGQISGTPAFMAPEQAKGAENVDARSDLYAVGCLAYWLLTGQLVFEGANPLEVLLHHVQTPPVPPSQRTEVPVPADLEAIVMSCLEKDPARGPQSAPELSGRLARCAAGNDWTPERARDWWDAHRPETVPAPA
jgi:eukaryotic-like serine/threonine-protein kinase